MCSEDRNGWELLVDSSHGIYTGAIFAEMLADEFYNFPVDTLEILRAGPDHDKYNDAYREIEEYAIHRESGKGLQFDEEGLWLVPTE